MSVPAGYRSRPAALDDVDAVDRLFRAVDEALFGTSESSRAWIDESWRSDRVDLPTMTLLVFSAEGGLAASVELEAIDPTKEIGAFARAPRAPAAWPRIGRARVDGDHRGSPDHQDTSTPSITP